MHLVTRWVGLCCTLSLFVGACGGGSRSGNGGTAGTSVGGNGSGGRSNGESGTGNAGTTSNLAGTTSEAGASSSPSGGSGTGEGGGGDATGQGGVTGEGGATGGASSSAGSAGTIGTGGSNVAGSTQGGAGGTPGSGSCLGQHVVFLIQRSGALFEQPGTTTTGVPLPLEQSYFGFLQAALVGEASATKPYRLKLPVGVSFLYAARDSQSPTPAVCPQLAATAPALQFDSGLSLAFAKSADMHAALVLAKQKEEAPVPESIASVVASWVPADYGRHLILVTTAMPDTCTKLDGPCGIDATLKAVQDAKAVGVTTHVIGLGDDSTFNNAASGPDPETGYEEYLQQLANAGTGKPLGPDTLEHKLQDFVCDGATVATLTASYAGTAGNAKYHQVKTATDAKTAVAEILASICP